MTLKCQVLEVSTKPYAVLFNFQTLSTLSLAPLAKVTKMSLLMSKDLHSHWFVAVIFIFTPKPFVQVGEYVYGESYFSWKPSPTNLDSTCQLASYKFCCIYPLRKEQPRPSLLAPLSYAYDWTSISVILLTWCLQVSDLSISSNTLTKIFSLCCSSHV